MSKSKVRVGDVYEVCLPSGFSYVHVTARNKMLGVLIRVLSGIYDKPIPQFQELVSAQELYFTYMFVADFSKENGLRYIANVFIKECEVHPLMRDGIRDPATGRVNVWRLWDGEKEWRIGDLNESQKTLSLRQIWNCEILKRRIVDAWLPCHEI